MRVLFVCMGNICRSPTAEALFRDLLRREAPALRVEVDSAGIHGLHAGEAPDPRAVRAARCRGLDLRGLQARPIARADFERCDLVLTMDREIHRHALRVAPAARHGRVQLLMDYADATQCPDVPDPYYGDEADFERVLDLVQNAAAGLLSALRVRCSAVQDENCQV